MRHLRALVFASLAGLSACSSTSDEPAPATTPTPQTLSQAMDGARVETGVPGVATAIVVDGSMVFEGVSGDFSRAPGRPLENTSLFLLDGITELATAPMVLQLVDAGRLRLDDRLDRYVPHVANADRITIEMLLRHRAGLRDYLSSIPESLYDPLQDPSHAWTRDEVLRAVVEYSEPDARYAYSRSEYVALGGVLERVTGRSIAALFRENVAAPAGLGGCAFAFDPARAGDVVHGFVLGKDGQYADAFPADGRVPTYLWGTVWTDRGLACDAGDTALLADALLRGRLTSPESLTLMTSFGSEGYGMGVAQNPTGASPVQGHAGAAGGISSVVWFDPARRLTIAALTNSDATSNAATVYRRMEEAYSRGARP